MATKEKAEHATGKGFSMEDVPVNSGGDVRKPSDVVDLYELPDKKFVKVRLHGPVFPYGGHWIETKKKDGGKANFYHPCAAFDMATGKVDSTKACAWCDDESGLVRFAMDYFMNGLHRKEQQNEPERIKVTKGEADSGYKDKNSESWTPNKAIRLTGSVLRRLQDLRQLNTHEAPDGETLNYPVSHAKYGCDVSIKRDKSVAPAQMYEIQMGAQAPMTKAERGFLIWDLSELMITPTEAATAAEHTKWAVRMGLIKPAKKKVEEDDEDEPVSKGKKRATSLDDDEDDEDEPAPKAKAKKKVVDDDFDDDEDEPAPKAKKKKAAVVEDDDDEDADDEDEPAPKKKVAKKSVADDDFDDEDDEPAPKVKAKKKAVAVEDDEDEPAPKKTKKAAVADDDFDDDEDEPAPKAKAKKKAVVVEEDDDDEDEPAPKKKATAAPVKKKKAVVEDDDDDFED